MAKKHLGELLGGEPPARPVIRRGQGLRLSTEAAEDAAAPAEERTIAPSHHRTDALAHERTDAPQYTRVNRGYKLREDLIKACKRIALEEDRLLYEVMEEALEAYIQRRNEAEE